MRKFTTNLQQTTGAISGGKAVYWEMAVLISTFKSHALELTSVITKKQYNF